MILTHFSAKQFNFNPYHEYPVRHPRAMKGLENFKPHGLWLSDESDYGWSHWCKDNDYGSLECRKDFQIDLSHVFVLTNYYEIKAFTEYFRLNHHMENFHIDWARLKKTHTGILITPYCWEARLQFLWYYGWDCASACIWDLRILKEETHGKGNQKVKQKETNQEEITV